MKITDVKMSVFNANLSIQPRGDIPAVVKKEYYLLTIETDEGVCGYDRGSCSFINGAGMMNEIEATVKPLILGKDPMDRWWIWKELYKMIRLRPLHMPTLGAIDTALWDLAGRAFNVPCHKLMGSYRDKVPAYASSFYHPTVEEYLDEAQWAKENHFKGYKVHGSGDWKFDLKVCQSLRLAQPDMDLMVDPTGAYTPTDALRFGYGLDELNFVWYEEPISPYDVHGYKMLHDKLKTPIAGPETNDGGLFSDTELLRAGAIDILRNDPFLKGGVTPCLYQAHIAEAFGMNCEFHVGYAPTLSLSMAVDNCDYLELMVPNASMEWGMLKHYAPEADGFVHACDEPGFGWGIDWDIFGGEPALKNY